MLGTAAWKLMGMPFWFVRTTASLLNGALDRQEQLPSGVYHFVTDNKGRRWLLSPAACKQRTVLYYLDPAFNPPQMMMRLPGPAQTAGPVLLEEVSAERAASVEFVGHTRIELLPAGPRVAERNLQELAEQLEKAENGTSRSRKARSGPDRRVMAREGVASTKPLVEGASTAPTMRRRSDVLTPA